MPTIPNIHINEFLTNALVSYQNESMLGEEVAPIIAVKKSVIDTLFLTEILLCVLRALM